MFKEKYKISENYKNSFFNKMFTFKYNYSLNNFYKMCAVTPFNFTKGVRFNIEQRRVGFKIISTAHIQIFLGGCFFLLLEISVKLILIYFLNI